MMTLDNNTPDGNRDIEEPATMKSRLDVLMPAYLASLANRGLTKCTIKTYRQRLGAFKTYLAECDRDFDRLTFIEYLEYLQEKGLAARSIRPAYSAIIDLSKWLLGNGEPAPCLTGIRAPRLSAANRYTPTDDEMAQLWNTAQAMPAYTEAERFLRGKALMLLTLLSATAIRKFEFLNIRLADLKTDLPGRSGWCLRVTKGKGKVIRDIPINPEAQALLSEWLGIRQVWVEREPARKRNPWLLPVDAKRPIGVGTVDAIVGRLNHVLGWQTRRSDGRLCNRVTSHCIRHWAATKMAGQPGVNLATVAEILGHARISTTLGYLHPVAEQLDRAVAGTSLSRILTPESQAGSHSAPSRPGRSPRSDELLRRRRSPGTSRQRTASQG